MDYCKLIFHGVPRLLFAHGYTTGQYRMQFQPEPRKYEITYIEQGDVRRQDPAGRTVTYAAPGFLFSRCDAAFTMDSPAPVHRHATIGFTAEAEVHAVSRDDIAACARHAFQPGGDGPVMAILPAYAPADGPNGPLEKQLKAIIRAYAVPASTRDLVCSAMLLELFAAMTEACTRDVLQQEDPAYSLANVVYARRAMQVIADNLHRKLRVEEVATELGISAGHLSRLFHQVTGQTLVDYINRVKCERVKALITNRQATLREAGDSVGIADVNYLSRLFKKVTGLTVQEYRMLQTDYRPRDEDAND